MARLLLAATLSVAVISPAVAMTLTSSNLHDGAPMPAAQIYPRCGGRNLSPQLAWVGPPPATRGFAVTMIDETVKPHGWSHWIVADLPAGVRSLPGSLVRLDAGRFVVSNFGDAGYDGPCPPPGTGTHVYRITVWALPSASVDLPPGGKADALEAQLSRLALDHASLTLSATAR